LSDDAGEGEAPLIWFFLVLGMAGIVGVFIWDYRRKAARRETASKQRFEQIFKGGAVPASPAAAPAPVPPVSVVSTPEAQASVTAFPPRDRFLGQSETLVYLLLKTGLPDHQIFANVTLASILAVPGRGADREQQLRRLSACTLDFVVCDRNMRVVAVVDLESPGSVDAAGAQRYKSDSLKAAGVRQVRLNVASLPSRATLRELVSGGPG
jgi:hypothetical protein